MTGSCCDHLGTVSLPCSPLSGTLGRIIKPAALWPCCCRVSLWSYLVNVSSAYTSIWGLSTQLGTHENQGPHCPGDLMAIFFRTHIILNMKTISSKVPFRDSEGKTLSISPSRSHHAAYLYDALGPLTFSRYEV